jgi:glycosyltransferase involved in cell wall biosynthesis
MIDILIPTYNREQDLIKNIKHLNNLVISENLENHFRILVSDNCSPDDTWEKLENIESEIKIELIKFRQRSNVGLEKNAIFLLEHSNAEFIMYIGDDDYLPEDYLKFVIDTLENDKKTCAIIPSITALFADGTTKPGRVANFDIKKYDEGLLSALKLSCFGHQLSGILLKRKDLAKNYLKQKEYRNIYPFIYFLSFNILRGSSCYAPKFKVLVSQSNSKDWGYDDSGLLTEMFKNFNILFPENPIKRFLLAVSILKKQGAWRLRIGKNPLFAIKSMFHVWKEKHTDILVKASLIMFIPYIYFRKILSFVKRKAAFIE